MKCERHEYLSIDDHVFCTRCGDPPPAAYWERKRQQAEARKRAGAPPPCKADIWLTPFSDSETT